MEKKKFYLILGVIVFLATVLRLRGFDTHFLLSSDTARDILVARGAILLHQLPWVGSFSSAGPFVFGPNWYWQLMFAQIIAPNIFLGPWIIMLLISIFFVFVIGMSGALLGNQKLGLLAALLTAVSPAAIGLSSYATQHGMIEIFSALVLLSFLAFLKTKKLIFAFLIAFSIGGAMSYHYQAINLLPYYPVLLGFYFWKNKSIKDNLKLIFILIFGSFIFLIPLLLWDFSRGFSNILHLIGYFKVGQYQIYVPNSWKIYLFSFWPGFLGKLVGGNFTLGAFLGIFTTFVTTVRFFQKKLSIEFLSLLIIFGMQFLMMRFFRSERYDGYLVYFHPITLLLVAFTINEFLKLNKRLGFVLTFGLIIFSIWTVMPVLDWNNDANNLMKINAILKSRYPGQKFSIYAKNLSASNVTFSQSLILEKDNLGNNNGKLLGVCLYNCDVFGTVQIAKGNFQGEPFEVVELEKREKGWYNFSAVAVYDDVQNWWKK